MTCLSKSQRRPTLNQVSNIEISPFRFQILDHEPTVTMMGLLFAAQKAAALERGGVNSFFDFPFSHQIEKSRLVNVPVAFVFLVCVQNICRRGQQWQVEVINIGNLFEEELKIVLFREASELRNIIEPDIKHPLGAAAAQELEEFRSSLFGKADGVNSGVSIRHLVILLSELRFAVRPHS